jgi:hypothetical protein
VTSFIYGTFEREKAAVTVNRFDQTSDGAERLPGGAGIVLRGLALMLAGLGAGYWYLVRPVHQAQLTGAAEYPVIMLIAVPCMIYAGVALIGVSLFGNASTRRVDASGRTRISTAGMIFYLSVLGSMVGMIAWWIHFTHSAGLSAF